MDRSDLLIEIADALQWAIIDAADRETHFHHLTTLINSEADRPRVVALLHATERRMRQLSTLGRLEIAATDRTEDRQLAADLRAVAGRHRTYLYHGTTFGRLRSIWEHGLMPRKEPVWKGRDYVENHAATAVFFTSSWRSAVQWAEIAHAHSRGRRTAANRIPVILRVSADGLTVESDRLAMAPGCLLVRSTVPTATAHVFISPLAGFPTWTPLALAVQRDPEKFPRGD